MSNHARRPRRHPIDAGANRRQSPRRPGSAIPDLKARLLAGSEVRLIDVSRRSVFIESDARLLPGSPISIRFVTTDATLMLKGTVVRSSVSLVSDTGLAYRTAVAFEEDIRLCDESCWDEADAAVAEVDVALRMARGGDETAAEPDVAAHATLVTTVFASSGDVLRTLLFANDHALRQQLEAKQREHDRLRARVAELEARHAVSDAAWKAVQSQLARALLLQAAQRVAPESHDAQSSLRLAEPPAAAERPLRTPTNAGAHRTPPRASDDDGRPTDERQLDDAMGEPARASNQ